MGRAERVGVPVLEHPVPSSGAKGVVHDCHGLGGR